MLILVRHGESTGNAKGLLLGRQDAPLTERGVAQARSLRPWISGATRLISSPLARARATAEELGTGLPIEIDERWIEVDYGELDGRTLGSVPPETWAEWRSDPDFRPSGGESHSEIGIRVRAACEELFAEHGGGARSDGSVVVVTHMSPIKAATCWALGLGELGSWRLYLATASITRIGWGVDGPVLHRFNETPWAQPA
jgi:probable phosphoglycerate mutase